MILRKPYAILIKVFKLIHIVLFALFIFLNFRLKSNYNFFQSLVGLDKYVPANNLVNEYIGISMYGAILVILFISIAIFYLMRQKEKPVLFYRILIIYSVSLLIALIVYSSFYNEIGDGILDSLTVSIYRDIIGAFYYITYFYIGFTFIRGFGFDIKKFSFEKDLKDLNISEADSEEYELSVGIDKEKIISAFRKEKRYAKYYFKENAMTLLIIAGIALIAVGFISYKNISKVIIYSQDKILVANNLEYQISNSYVISVDKYGVNLNSNYVIVLFKVTNNYDEDLSIDINRNRIKIDEEYFYPVTNAYYNFSDLGEGYKDQIIDGKSSNEFMFVFKTKGNVREKNIVLELYDGSIIRNNKSISQYKRYRLDKEYFTNSEVLEYKLNDVIKFNNKVFNEESVMILKYAIAYNFVDEYEECVNDKCSTLKKVISNGNRKIIKFTVDGSNILEELFGYYASLNYKIDEDEYTISRKDFNLLYKTDNAVYLGVSNDISNGHDIELRFDIRGSLYSIMLDEDDTKDE